MKNSERSEKWTKQHPKLKHIHQKRCTTLYTATVCICHATVAHARSETSVARQQAREKEILFFAGTALFQDFVFSQATSTLPYRKNRVSGSYLYRRVRI